MRAGGAREARAPRSRLQLTSLTSESARAALAGENIGAEQKSLDHFVILKVFRTNLRFEHKFCGGSAAFHRIIESFHGKFHI